LTQVEHLLSRLQAFSDVNMRLMTAVAIPNMAPGDEVFDAQAAVLQTMKSELKHLSPFLLDYLQKWDTACMDMLSRINENETLHQIHKRTFNKFGHNLCDHLRIPKTEEICTPEFLERSKLHPFGSIWQITRLWRTARSEEKSMQSSEYNEWMKSCIPPLRAVLAVVLREMLPCFIQRMNFLRSLLVANIEAGKRTQSSILAACASGFIGATSFVAHSSAMSVISGALGNSTNGIDLF